MSNRSDPSRSRGDTRYSSFTGRAALHLGLALITWSFRPRRYTRRAGSADRWVLNERMRERVTREERWLHSIYLQNGRH